MKLRIGISPCPNDTFIFDAIYNKKIDLHGFEFDFIMEDVEYLNKAALKGEMEVTKLSYFAFSKITSNYQMLNSGGALGQNCGPLLVSRNETMEITDSLKIAIPGFNTTANFLLTLAHPQLKNKSEVLFSEIENNVLEGIYDLGLIIHESRFTYREKGLHKILDLGEFWEEKTNSPIPLGGIVIKRELDQEIKEGVDQIIMNSVRYAFDNPENSKDFVKAHSQELSDEVINAHIQLYVNQFSLTLGKYGQNGVYKLFEELSKVGLISDYTAPLFVSET